jgi:autotransporter family porin
MAIFTVSNTGGNYNVGTTWVGGVAPSTTDTVEFTATSGNLTINVGSTCAGINFTNYVGIITISTSFTINGDINLGTGGYTVAGGNTLYAGATGTITSNGTTWTGNFGFSGASQTYTLADDLTIVGTLTLIGTGIYTCNGFNIYCNSTLQVLNTGTFAGTTNIIFNGTGAWSHIAAGIIAKNITINTAGTLTINTARFTTGTLTYTSGTVITTGGALVLYASCTLNTVGINWNQVLIVSSGTIANNSTLTINGTFTIGGGTVSTTINGSDVIINNNLSYTSISDGGVGTALFRFNGTGVWTSAGYLRNNVLIDTVGTLTFSGNVYYFSGTLTYVTGTIITTGSTLNLGTGSILNTIGINWNTVLFTGTGATLTLTTDLYCNQFNMGANAKIINGANIYNAGSLAAPGNTGNVQGTSTIIMNGTGTISSPGGSYIGINVTIDTIGTITISGVLNYRIRTFTYISGIVITTGSNLTLVGSCTLNTNGINWNNITLTSATYVLNSTLTANFIAIGTAGITSFSGTSGFTVGILSCLVAGKTLNFEVGKTYTITNTLNITGTSGSKITISSSSAYAFLILQFGATQLVENCNATNIDSSGGQTIYTSSGTLTNTINWSIGTPPTSNGNFFLMF